MEETYKLEIKKTLKASPEVVYDAFTNKEELEQWYFGPGLKKSEVRELDLSEGGRFEIAMIGDENTYVVEGTFKELNQPHKIVHTWRWLEPKPGAETLVTITLTKVDEGTEMLFVHEGFKEEKQSEMHKQGWTSMFEDLEKKLS